MPFVPIPDVVEIDLRANHPSGERHNVFHYAYEGSAPTLLELDGLLDTIVDNILPAYIPVVSVNTVFDQITATDLGGLLPRQVSRDLNVTGTAGGDTCPSNVALCLTKKTPIPLHRARGRFFMHGITETNTNGDFVQNALMAGALNLGAKLLLHFWTERFWPVVASRKFSTWAEVASIFIDGVLDSQRRRLAKRGV